MRQRASSRQPNSGDYSEPDPKSQRNFTDPESRIMKSKDGFVQAYNAQAAVDAGAQIIVAHEIITSIKNQSMEDAGKVAAIGRAQAVIEFQMDGTIISANQNFLDALGYTPAEIQGKHHSMFVEPGMRDAFMRWGREKQNVGSKYPVAVSNQSHRPE